MIEKMMGFKNDLLEQIKNGIEKYKTEFSGINRWSDDSLFRLSEFISKGKLIRSILIVSGYYALGGKDKKKIMSVAASVEFLHAGFLMHDDVMDQDEIRRGSPSIHVAYKNLFKSESCGNPEKNGESFAICVGNIAYFLAFDQIAESGFEDAIILELTKMLNKQAVVTGFGQMNDIYTASSLDIPDKNVILGTYIAKTARYTFSLPLTMGAVCAGLKKETINDLIRIGEEIGTVFQLRDDELNLFGSSESVGKSVGGDIFEGKKTFILSMFLDRVKSSKKNEILNVLAKKDVSCEYFQELKELIISTGTLKEHGKIILKRSDTALKLINNLDVSDEYKNILKYILKLSYERKF